MEIKKTEKPWGYEQIVQVTDGYVLKRIFIKKGHRLSLQYHEKKEETIYILSGDMDLIRPGKLDKHMRVGSVKNIPPKTVHRFQAPRGDVLLLEVSTPELDDVVRLEDDYGRK